MLMSQREKTAAVIFRVFGCCLFLIQAFDAASCAVMDVLRGRLYILDLTPYFFYAAAGVALFALSKPLARLVVRGIGYD
jgi:hypothetical protein